MSLSLSWTQGQCSNPKKPFSARDVPVKYGTVTLDPSFIVWQSHLCKPNLVHVHILCTYGPDLSRNYSDLVDQSIDIVHMRNRQCLSNGTNCS